MKQTFKQQDLKMKKTTLEKNETVWESNWNDTAANKMTRKGNKVYVKSIYRYGPSRSEVMSYADFRKWRKGIKYYEGLFNT